MKNKVGKMKYLQDMAEYVFLERRNDKDQHFVAKWKIKVGMAEQIFLLKDEGQKPRKTT